MRPGQPGIAGVEGAEEAVQFLLRGQVAQADAPRGEGVPPVAADGEHSPGGQTVRRAGRFDRHADAFGVQLPLEHGALDVLDAQIQDVGDRVLRAVDVHLRVLAEGVAEEGIRFLYPGGTRGQLPNGGFQRRFQRGRQGHGRRAAAVDSGALAAVDERLEGKLSPLEQ